jgi:hypothetical protein
MLATRCGRIDPKWELVPVVENSAPASEKKTDF